MSAVIFNGDRLRALRAALRLNDQATIWSGPNDPTVTPTLGNQGDIYIKFGASPAFYQKQTTSGTDTNWGAFGAGNYTPATPGNWSPDPTTVAAALDQLAARTFDSNYNVEKITLSGTDISNKFITLLVSPITAAKTRLTVIGGPEQEYSADFSVTGSQLSWSGLGLDGVLISGDKLIVDYSD